MLSSALSNKASFLNRVITSAGSLPAREFSVAFNVKSKFETAFETKMKTLATQPQKM